MHKKTLSTSCMTISCDQFKQSAIFIYIALKWHKKEKITRHRKKKVLKKKHFGCKISKISFYPVIRNLQECAFENIKYINV